MLVKDVEELTTALAAINALPAAQFPDGKRWEAIESLMILGDVELNQDEDGGYSIGVDPVGNFAGQIWRGNTPEEAVDKVVSQLFPDVTKKKAQDHTKNPSINDSNN